MKIRSRKLLLVILGACVCVAPNSFHFPRATAQQPANTVTIPGLHARVTIRRDERGIPYIEAANDEDLYFAQGYVTASDRLWQMDLLRRTVRGELAEIFGNPALGQDKTHRVFGFAGILDEAVTHVPANLSVATKAYS